MRILTGIGVPYRPFGGSLLCTNDWYSDLPEGVEVRFLALPPPQGQPKWWTIEDVRFLDVEMQPGAAAFTKFTDEIRQAVLQELDDFQPDIIHSQHLNYNLARVFADLELAIPKLGICHGTDVQLSVRDEFFRDNMKHICDALDTLVFPNQNMLSDFEAVYGPTDKAVISPLGIPDHYYTDTPRPITYDGSRPLRVLYAGRLLNWKGADLAVEAMSLASRPMELTVIGNEDERGYKDRMLAFREQHGLQDRVSFRDQLPREELFCEFDNHDVIVFPSKGLEAFSLTVVEAQIHGLPVIAADSGGIANTMGDGGILIPMHDAAALAGALDSICADPAILQDLQRRGYTNAELYRLSGSKRRLFDLSRQLIAARAA